MTSTSTRAFSLFAIVLSITGIAYAQQTPPAENKPAETKPAETKPAQTKPAPRSTSARIDAPIVPPTTLVKPKPQPKLPKNIVARVGSQDISRDDVLAMFNMVGGRPIVDQMVQATLLEQEAKRLNISVNENELNKAIDEAKLSIVARQESQGPPLTFKEIAERDGFNDNLIRWSVRLDILRRKTFAKAIESQIPSRDSQSHLAHILAATIPLPKPGEEAKPLTPEEQKKKEDDAKAKIDRLLDEVKTGKKTWDEAAKESEDSSNAQTGGDLGWYPKGQLDPDFEKAAFNIQKSGEIVGPVKSRYGWHLIKLIQKGTELSAAEKASYRQQQVMVMQNNPQMLNNWLNTLKAKKTVIFNRQAQIVPGAKIPARMLEVAASKKAATGKSSKSKSR